MTTNKLITMNILKKDMCIEINMHLIIQSTSDQKCYDSLPVFNNLVALRIAAF
jgi:hypothetical protein